MRMIRYALAAGLAVFVLTASDAPVLGAQECTATLDAELAREETRDEAVVTYFRVEIDTAQDCAKVYVDLVVTERFFNGEEVTSTHRSWRKVTAPATYEFDHRIARDSTLAKWEFRMARCVVCGTE